MPIGPEGTLGSGPTCTTTTITNAGHLVQGDNPQDFLAAARAHLERAEGLGS